MEKTLGPKNSDTAQLNTQILCVFLAASITVSLIINLETSYLTSVYESKVQFFMGVG